MMKLANLLLTAFFLSWLAGAHAEIIENDPRIQVRTIEPTRDVGYTVGDTISRTVILEAPRYLQLIETSLPVAGNDKKRKGRGSGIELEKATLEKSVRPDKNIYTLHLTYQLFTGGVVARPASMPPEFVKFAGKGESFDFRIPSWSFRMSPLAVFGQVVVEKDMSGFRGPLLLSSHRNYQILWALLGILALSALGLLYVLGSTTWLPRMGGPFARALRDLKKLPNSAEGLTQGVARLHEAFNATAGGSVFDRAGFLALKPGFAPVSADIERFFSLSRTVFFDPSASHGIDDPQAWLRQLCRRCRDCERGLK
jgi:mxaA protein